MTDDRESSSIVVGVDGSETSIEALREARRLAEPLNAAIEAIICWDLPAMIILQDEKAFSQNAEKLLLQAVEKAFGTDRPVNLRTTLVRGPARQSLIEASSRARMLVVGRRGHSALGGWFVGSVSGACVARAHCPVLVVHTPEDQRNADPRMP